MSSHRTTHDQDGDLLADLAAQVAAVLVEMLGLAGDVAEHAGNEAADHIATHWRGQHIYVPKEVSKKALSRHLQIYAEFNGRNYSELARKYDISLTWMYKIIKMTREAEMRRRQHRLPFDEPALTPMIGVDIP